jgi:hypothetical protein
VCEIGFSLIEHDLGFFRVNGLMAGLSDLNPWRLAFGFEW